MNINCLCMATTVLLLGADGAQIDENQADADIVSGLQSDLSEVYPLDQYIGNATLQDGDKSSALSSLNTALIVVYSTVTIVGLIANMVVFFVICAGRERGRPVTVIYILHLAIADTVFLLTLPIFTMQTRHNYWDYSEGWCTFFHTVKYINYNAGIFFLTAMSIDRYIAVAYSSSSTQIRTKKRTYIVCGVTWLVSILMSVPVMLYARIEQQGSDLRACKIMFPGYEYIRDDIVSIDISFAIYDDYDENATAFDDYEILSNASSIFGNIGNNSESLCDYEDDPTSYKVWLWVNFILTFVLPIGVIVFMYAMILLHVRKVERNIGHSTGSARMRKRVTKMVGVLVAGFVFCWMPYHVLTLAKIPGISLSHLTCYGLEEFLIALAFSNSALNPMLYTFVGSKFKERFTNSVRNTDRFVRGNSSRRSLSSRRAFGSYDTSRNTTAVFFRKEFARASVRSNFTVNEMEHCNDRCRPGRYVTTQNM